MTATTQARWLGWAIVFCLAALTEGLAVAASPVVDSPLPDLSLPALDDSQRTLSERDGPTVLVFFRGVW